MSGSLRRWVVSMVSGLALVPLAACSPCGEMVASQSDAVQGTAVYVAPDGTSRDLGSLLVRDMNHWRDSVVVEWVHTDGAGTADFHLGLIMKHLGDGVSGSIPLSRVTAYVCHCPGTMLPSNEQQAFVDCIAVVDGRPWSVELDCFPLDGSVTITSYEQDCIDDSRQSRCAQRIELEFVGSGTSQTEASFGASFHLDRYEELAETACIE